MLRIVLLICFSAFGLRGFSQGPQGTLEQYENWFTPTTAITEYRPKFQLESKDLRSASKNPLDFEAFSAGLPVTLKLFLRSYYEGQDKLPQIPPLKPKKIILEMQDFQLAENASGKAVLKADVLVMLRGGDFSSLNSEFRVSAEEETSIKMKQLSDPKQEKKVAPVINSFIENFRVKMVRKILEEMKQEKAYVLQVKTVGKVLTQSADKNGSHKKATLNALLKASDLAFETHLFRDLKVQELEEIQHRIQSTGGRLLYAKPAPNSAVHTTDGYSCVFLVSVIKKK